MFQMEKLRYRACKFTWQDEETARYPFLTGGLAAGLAKLFPGPGGLSGLLGTRTVASLGLLRRPSLAGVLPSLPIPRDAGLTGGRLRLGIKEGRHFPLSLNAGGSWIIWASRCWAEVLSLDYVDPVKSVGT